MMKQIPDTLMCNIAAYQHPLRSEVLQVNQLEPWAPIIFHCSVIQIAHPKPKQVCFGNSISSPVITMKAEIHAHWCP